MVMETEGRDNLTLKAEASGYTFESRRARHLCTELGTQKLAVFPPEAATSVRSSTLIDPMMRTPRRCQNQSANKHLRFRPERAAVALACKANARKEISQRCCPLRLGRNSR